MALDKSIRSGKERRRRYRGAKAVDATCRNHGSCPHCRVNREFSTKRRLPMIDALMEGRDTPFGEALDGGWPDFDGED